VPGETATVDNDVLFKMACFGLLNELPDAVDVPSPSLYVLGAARFVVGKLIKTSQRVVDRDNANAAFEAFLGSVSEIEPSDNELSLSTRIEELAIERGLDLHAGESQLCAVSIMRAMSLLITGDKHAIISIETLFDTLEELSYLNDRVMCLEQIILTLVIKLGHEAVRQKVCPSSKVDTAIAICCGCALSSQSRESMVDGLRSYIRALRQEAPRPLCTTS